MAYLPHINDPSVLCDSTVFSDPTSDSILASFVEQVTQCVVDSTKILRYVTVRVLPFVLQ
jgi:hypothetical protein